MSEIKTLISNNILPVELRDIPTIMKGDKGDPGRDGSFIQKGYKTYAAMIADKQSIPANSNVVVNNDPDKSKNAYYTYDGTTFTKGDFDPQVVLETIDSRLDLAVEAASDYFQSQVASTVDTSLFNSTVAYNQAIEVTKGQWANTISATDTIIKANSTAYLATIPTTVNAAINNTAVEGGVLADTFVTVTSNALGSVPRNQRDKNSDIINVKDFGAKGDGVTDDTAAFNRAIAYINSKLNVNMSIPEGRYKVGELIPIESRTFSFKGVGSANSIIESSRVGGAAISIDAWTNADVIGSPPRPFINASQIGDFRVIAPQANTLLYARGLARCSFKDIRLNGTDRSVGTNGLYIASTQLCYFENIYVAYPDGDTPENGIFISNAPRYTTAAGVAVSGGLPSCNTFINVFPEGCDFGIMLANGDQNTFIGGSPEGAKKRSLTVGSSCKYNTFIGMGFESKDATGGEISDGGNYTKYINCYASHVDAVRLAGRGIVIDGGYYQKITLGATSKGCSVENITVGHWHQAVGDNGGVVITAGAKGARFKNIYSSPLDKYLYPNNPRFSVTPTGTPFEWENLEGVPVKFMLIDGTVTQVMVKRGTDQWAETVPPASGRTVYSLLAGDKIVVSYTVAPIVNIIPQNGV